MTHKRIGIKILMVLCSAVLLAFTGCGKKESPLPPEINGNRIAAPFNLKYRSYDTEIVLSWDHKINQETAAVTPEGFDIFMNKKTFDDCEGCPFEFEKIGHVVMPSMAFVNPIEKGFKYYFRVQATGDGQMKSEFSKTVQFESP
ncbi:hypothetical protein [Desulfobacula sp.]|uniref:hypothetical protein n=1 Tax=Desulfobacula sp. TaxID=2593537 RepID=UPI00260C2B63|nr:hypothetical protein [Desulfobacula sp.]